jgi:DNA-binding NtrC family response regulator
MSERTVENSKILLVDDDQDLLFIYKSKISSWGNYEVETEHDPRQVRERLQNETFDLIISDIVLNIFYIYVFVILSFICSPTKGVILFIWKSTE